MTDNEANCPILKKNSDPVPLGRLSQGRLLAPLPVCQSVTRCDWRRHPPGTAVSQASAASGSKFLTSVEDGQTNLQVPSIKGQAQALKHGYCLATDDPRLAK